MPRRASSSSGPARTVSINLPPADIDRLDGLAAEEGISRSAVVRRLLDATGGMPLSAYRGALAGADGSNTRSIEPRRSLPVPAEVAGGPLVPQEVQARRKEAGDALIKRIKDGPTPLPSDQPLPGMACKHGKYVVINGGMRRCEECGAIRGARGVWKAP